MISAKKKVDISRSLKMAESYTIVHRLVSQSVQSNFLKKVILFYFTTNFKMIFTLNHEEKENIVHTLFTFW